MQLTDSQQMVRETMRNFAQQRLAPFAAAWDREHAFPRDALRELAALGACGIVVPESYGGAGLDYVSLALALEEIAAGDGATSTVISVQNSVVCGPIFAFGTAAQKDRYLKPLASGTKIGCFCLTEPHTGSDAAAIATRAEFVRGRDDDGGGHYVLNGTKQFITSGKNADVAIVFALTDKAAGKKGMSAFIVDTALPGYDATRIEDKLGQRASDTAQIVLSDWGFRPPTCWAAKARGTGSRWPISSPGASASPRRPSAWHAPLSRRRCRMRKSGKASASRLSSIRRSVFGSPTWLRRSKPPGNSPGMRRACETQACRA